MDARDGPRVVGLELVLHVLLVLAEQLRVQLDVAGLLRGREKSCKTETKRRGSIEPQRNHYHLSLSDARRHRGPARVRWDRPRNRRTFPNAAAIENIGVTSAKAL